MIKARDVLRGKDDYMVDDLNREDIKEKKKWKSHVAEAYEKGEKCRFFAENSSKGFRPRLSKGFRPRLSKGFRLRSSNWGPADHASASCSDPASDSGSGTASSTFRLPAGECPTQGFNAFQEIKVLFEGTERLEQRETEQTTMRLRREARACATRRSSAFDPTTMSASLKALRHTVVLCCGDVTIVVVTWSLCTRHPLLLPSESMKMCRPSWAGHRSASTWTYAASAFDRQLEEGAGLGGGDLQSLPAEFIGDPEQAYVTNTVNK
ncbi:Hypp6962 [Branchiostoma lanceolatum]|uniref:Hypp6962 protein n=1 Tax=Branchiostoma lanceolatum TaxID=7740 RepID=A0A8J9YVT7_BRALA|nr:Hypp6962 [Branchiostoma lanceolatum]